MFKQIARLSYRLNRIENIANYCSPWLGSKTYQASRSFSICQNWPQSVKSVLKDLNISQPTLIQEQTLPISLEKKDLVGIARTGSGKTLAFVLPAVMRILEQREARTSSDQSGDSKRLPTCLVLSPTRELAAQTADVFSKFSSIDVRSICLVGGAARNVQISSLSRFTYDVYIATPGRLQDLIDSKEVDLSNIKYLVFDEADRMLDMGFEPQIRSIVQESNIPKDRQTLMWSATWPKEIQNLASNFLNNFEFVAVDSEQLKANPNIKQTFMLCSRDKFETMLEALRDFKKENDSMKVLVFVNTKRLAEGLARQLARERFQFEVMHGGLTQRQRDYALKYFRHKSTPLMIATDVAARGLDIDNITHVINYDFPNSIEDYIHRIGRTARHQKSGVALSFLAPQDYKHRNKLIKVLKETNQEVPFELEAIPPEDDSDSGLNYRRNSYRSQIRYRQSPYNDRRQSPYDDRQQSPSYNRRRSSYDDFERTPRNVPQQKSILNDY